MKKTLIKVKSRSLGDTVAALPYINKFQENLPLQQVHVNISDKLIELFKPVYPALAFSPSHSTESFDRVIELDYNFNKPIQAGYAEQLGFANAEYIRPKISIPTGERPIKSKYIAIGVHSTAQLKYWNHPLGKKSQAESLNWNELCSLLRKQGYTPVVVEEHQFFGIGPNWNGVPNKANKKIGQSLIESMNIVYHAEFYIGLSSGMAWVAHAMGKPVAMIANFTEKWNEFDLSCEDYIRITDESVCHGCFNKVNLEFPFIAGDWYWCPLHKDTARQFECHTAITPARVMEQIQKWLV